MKWKTRLAAGLAAVLLTLSLAGCDQTSGSPMNTGAPSTSSPSAGDPGNNAASTAGPDDFKKYLHQAIRKTGGLPTFVEAEDGYYMGYGWLYYIDKATWNVTRVCGKPECDHTDPETCNAAIDGDELFGANDKIYYISNIAEPKLLWSVNPDGTQRQTVQELKFNEFSSSQSTYSLTIYHRGYLYYVSDDILYRVKLGGEKDSAEAIWSPENPGTSQSIGGQVQFNPNAMRFHLWADGDFMYFMVNLQVEDGTYKDVLFQCDLNTMDVQQVWQTPDQEEVGDWEKTGVSVSQWYVLDGYIYFYLSGGDMWRTDLSTGKHEKLADTHEQTQYGSAIFSDEYMCLLNDYPVMFYGDPTVTPGGQFRSYGDTIFVYGLDGKLVKEISLKNLYEDPEEMAEMNLLACIGNDIFFRTTGRHVVSGGGLISQQAKQGGMNLCRADIETGEVQVLYQLR